MCRKNLNGEDTSQREYIRSPQNNEQATAEAQSNTTSPLSSTQGSQSSSANNSNENNRSNPNRPNNNNNAFYEPDFD